MGLDMYLGASFYFGGYEHIKATEKKHFDAITNLIGIQDLVSPHAPSVTVKVPVMYWRKANAIHGWFIDHCSRDQVDDCQPIYVGRSDLEKLLEAVTKEINREEDSGLEPRDGCFFGSQKKDEWYYEQVEDTRKDLQKILADERLKYADFTYHASW
jgi:hypothetical protein